MTEKSHPSQFTLIAELFGVITALAFVTSGVVNGILFYSNWHLNYFLIASPSDVVMTGFIFVSILLVIGIAISLFVLLMSIVFSRFRRMMINVRESLQSFGQSLTEDQRTAIMKMLDASERMMLQVVAATISLFVVSLSFLFTQTTKVANLQPINSNTNIPTYQFSYLTGLRITPSNDSNDRCWAAPVLWMGGDRAVIGCRDGIPVVVATDGLKLQPITVQVGSPKPVAD